MMKNKNYVNRQTIDLERNICNGDDTHTLVNICSRLKTPLKVRWKKKREIKKNRQNEENLDNKLPPEKCKLGSTI